MIELTVENTAEYLRTRGWLEPGPAQVETLGWGVSNAVLRVTTPERRFVVKQSRPQLRTREAWFSNVNRVYREVEVMRLLGPVLPPLTVPEVLFEDRENYLFGMSHAPEGAVVWKESLLAGETRPEVARHAGRILGLIHERTADRPELIDRLGDRAVFKELRIDPFYERIRERHADLADAVTPVIDEMNTRNDALCHGDFSPKNLLVHPCSSAPCEGGAGNFTLVDYETAHFGDPTMDLGFFLSHLVLKAVRHYPRHEQYLSLTQRFWEGYRSVVQFREMKELEARAVPHFAICALARVDGTSPVDYLPGDEQRTAVRRFAREVLRERPNTWLDTLTIVRSWPDRLTAS
jgi:5-methylthioribose kinase